jgi:ribosomal protein S18 acetylase RimI-like enzyme
VRAAVEGIQRRGAKVAQALVTADEMGYAAALVACGFRNITQLQYLRHDLQSLPVVAHDLRLEPYCPANRALFHATLERTYEGTLDCPELDGVRTIDEVIEGHVAQGKFQPDRWWLAFARLSYRQNIVSAAKAAPPVTQREWAASVSERSASEESVPVGVALAIEMPEGDAWDLSYLGVTPEARGQGIGRVLAAHVLAAASQGGSGAVVLAVDVRNRPALQLYESLGFERTGLREVYLLVLGKPLPNAG